MTGKTGETCQRSGIYTPENAHKHAAEIALSKGERFPPCAGCRLAITWSLRTPTEKS